MSWPRILQKLYREGGAGSPRKLDHPTPESQLDPYAPTKTGETGEYIIRTKNHEQKLP